MDLCKTSAKLAFSQARAGKTRIFAALDKLALDKLDKEDAVLQEPPLKETFAVMPLDSHTAKL